MAGCAGLEIAPESNNRRHRLLPWVALWAKLTDTITTSIRNLEITIQPAERVLATIWEPEAPAVPSYWIVEAKDYFMLPPAPPQRFRYNVFHSENMISLLEKASDVLESLIG